MKQKIIVYTLITILLIGAISTPISVLATTKSGYDEPKNNNEHDDDKNKTGKDNEHDDDKNNSHNSCNLLPKETPFRDVWIFVCNFQIQINHINLQINQLNASINQINNNIKQINDKIDKINSGGGGSGGGSSNQWCPTGKNISLGHATLQLQNLVGCDLSQSYLGDSIMQYANLRGANLTNSVLTGASLNYADLSNAILTGTNFDHADLTGIATTGCHGTPIGTPVAGTLPICGP